MFIPIYCVYALLPFWVETDTVMILTKNDNNNQCQSLALPVGSQLREIAIHTVTPSLPLPIRNCTSVPGWHWASEQYLLYFVLIRMQEFSILVVLRYYRSLGDSTIMRFCTFLIRADRFSPRNANSALLV